jgi:hypothetical protein
LCQKCVDGEVVVYCPDGTYCLDGVCTETEECQDDEDCPEGQCCVDNECVDGYCHYNAEIVWFGEGVGDACPEGFQQSGLSELGKRICQTCDTEQDGECDEAAWWEGIAPGGDWSLILNSLGGSGDCNPERPCGGGCNPDYPGSCCDGCECVEVDVDYYECQAEEPPP